MLQSPTLKKTIESSIIKASPIYPLPKSQWASARGLWTARSSGDELFPFTPDESYEFDLIWISENPGIWDKPHPDPLYSSNSLNWERWNRHYGDHLNIAHWRNIRKAIPRISKLLRAKILFSNAYLFEWPQNKKFSESQIAKWFVDYQGDLLNFLHKSGQITERTKICLCGRYAKAAWSLYEQQHPQDTNNQVLTLGHPAYGHLAKSLQQYGL